MMIAQPLSSQIALRGSPLASRPQPRQAQAAPMRMAPVAAKGPAPVALQLLSAAAAASLALLPLAGPALAEPPIQSAKKAAKGASDNFPEIAFNQKAREQQITKNARGLVEKFATIKDRIDADTALANNAYGNQNIFFPSRNTDSNKVNLFKPEAPVSFVPASAPRLTFVALSTPDLASRQPRDDPLKPSGTGGQPDLPVSPGQAADAVKGAVEGAKDKAGLGGLGGALEGLKDKINGAAITDESPAKNLTDSLNKPANWSMGPLRVTMVGDPAGFGGAGGASRDLDSNYGGENTDAGTGANPKQGGDLKNAPNKFAAEFQGRATDTAAFAGGNPVGEGVKNIRDTAQQVPNFLGGGGVIRDESVSPEQAAKDNIATAKAGTGSVLDSAKSALGIK